MPEKIKILYPSNTDLLKLGFINYPSKKSIPVFLSTLGALGVMSGAKDIYTGSKDIAQFIKVLENASLQTTNVDKYLIENYSKPIFRLGDAAQIDSAITSNFKNNKLKGRITKAQALVNLNKGNPVVFKGKEGRNILVSKETGNPIILQHEIGHFKDFDRLGIKSTLESNVYSPSLIKGLSKKEYQKKVINRELEAWKNVPESAQKTRIMGPAIKSYEGNFKVRKGGAKGMLGIGAILLSLLGFSGSKGLKLK